MSDHPPQDTPSSDLRIHWKDALLALGYLHECVQSLFAQTPPEKFVPFDDVLLVAEKEEEAGVLFGKRVDSLLFLESLGKTYSQNTRALKNALSRWLATTGAEFVSTRILTRHLHKWHALSAVGFYPVEVLIHLFYEFTPEFSATDLMTSDVVPLSEVSNDDLMDLVRRAGLKSHIHLDPHLSPEIGDLAISMYLARLAGLPGAVASRRNHRVCGFLIARPRPIPLPGYPPIYELVIGAVDATLTDRAAIFRDMVSVLAARVPLDASLFEVRIPHTWLNDTLALARAHPSAIETSVVLHYLKNGPV
ncbi:MAG: hypothetical protein V2G42_05900 [bacterium JZ-2024 1]